MKALPGLPALFLGLSAAWGLAVPPPPVAVPGTGLAVDGRVVDSNGTGVAGARIELRPIATRDEAVRRKIGGADAATPAAAGASAPDGRFTLTAPGPGMWEVIVEATGFVPARRAFVPLLEDMSLLPVELSPAERPVAGTPAREVAAGTRRTIEVHGARNRRLPPVRPLSGHILDQESRRPIVNAFVWPESDPARAVRTDSAGFFRLPAAGRDEKIGAAALGYFPAFAPVAGRPALSMFLSPALALSGSVVDEAGKPLPDAEVRIRSIDWRTGEVLGEACRRTSTPGTFRIPGLKPGSAYDLRVDHPGSVRFTLRGQMPASGAVPPLRLVLSGGRTAVGQVVDEAGQAIEDAGIEMAFTRSPSGDAVDRELAASFRASTGPDGRFSISNLPAGWFSLWIRRDGFVPLDHSGVEIPAGGRPADLGRFNLERGAVLSGSVVDSSGNPIAGAKIRAWSHANPNRFLAAQPAAVTAEDGGFEIWALPGGYGVDLNVHREGFQDRFALYVPEISPDPVRVVLERRAPTTSTSIAGRVLDPSGAPVAGASLWSMRGESWFPSPGHSSSDDEGRFTFDSLTPGWWTVRVEAGRYLETRSRPLHISEGEHLEGVEIVLQEAGVVTGRVFNPKGDPVPGMGVQSGSSVHPVLTAGDGSYRMEGLALGELDLFVVGSCGEEADGKLTVAPGVNRFDLTLTRSPRCHEIRGRVTGPDGSAVAGAWVHASGEGSAMDTYTSTDGSFVLSGPGNTYTLWADKDGYASAQAAGPVQLGGSGVAGIEIRLGAVGSIRGHLSGLSPRDLESAKIKAKGKIRSKDGIVNFQSTYRIPDLAPGDWKVVAQAGRQTVEGEVTLSLGESEAVLDLAFTPAPASHEVTGRVLGPRDEPVAGVQVRLAGPDHEGFSALSQWNGSFHIDAEDGDYQLFAEDPGCLGAAPEETVRVEGRPVSGLEIRFREAAAVRGRLLGLEPWDDGSSILAVPVGGGVAGGGGCRGQLDYDGGYVIPHLGPGRWEVRGSHDRRVAKAAVEILPGQTEAEADLDFSADQTPKR